MLTYGREYLDIIDLTGEPEGSAESDSEIDDLPLAPITMSQAQRTNDRSVIIYLGNTDSYTVVSY